MRTVLFSLAALIGLGFVSFTSAAETPKPNVIFIRLSERVLTWQKELPTGPLDPGAGQMNYALPGGKPRGR